jgi:hypothetical protein
MEKLSPFVQNTHIYGLDTQNPDFSSAFCVQTTNLKVLKKVSVLNLSF